MASEFITRVEHGKDEPYTVIFRTDDADKYKHIEDECRRMIGHNMPTVDAVPVVRCGKCKYFVKNTWECVRLADRFGDEYSDARVYPEYYCADGERRTV